MNMQTAIKKAAAAIVGTSLALGAIGCSENISQNESAIETKNGKIVDDNVTPGRNWYFSPFSTIDFPRITTTTQTATITVADGQKCELDCIPVLQTNNQQTVSGSLTAVYYIGDLDVPGRPKTTRSPMADLFLIRGIKDENDDKNQQDVREKLLMPPFRDCVIESARKRNSYEVNDQGDKIKGEVKDCLSAAVLGYHLIVTNVYDNGFGPSPEAREAMRRFSNAKQEGQIADANVQSRDKRIEAAEANAQVGAAAYKKYKDLGIPDDKITELMCLMDANSASRPCVKYTATGGAVPAHQ